MPPGTYFGYWYAASKTLLLQMSIKPSQFYNYNVLPGGTQIREFKMSMFHFLLSTMNIQQMEKLMGYSFPHQKKPLCSQESYVCRKPSTMQQALKLYFLLKLNNQYCPGSGRESCKTLGNAGLLDRQAAEGKIRDIAEGSTI